MRIFRSVIGALLLSTALGGVVFAQGPAPNPPPRIIGRLPPAQGESKPFAGLGPLAGKINAGESGSWVARDDGGRLVLSNKAGEGAIRFYVTDWQGDLQAGRSASVRVAAQANGKISAAGLIFRVSDGDPRWMAFVVTADGKVAAFARTATELRRLGTYDIPGGHRPDGDLLQLNQRGAVAQLLANGRVVSELGANDTPNVAAPVGVVAMGTGEFTLDGFAFGPAVVPSGGAPGGDDTVPPPRTAGDDTLPNGGGGATPRAPLRSFTADTFGALFGILAHEFGHFMIGELKIPATGPEEDVADEFAAMVFIDNMKDSMDMSVAMAAGNAKLWWYMAEAHGDNATPFYDEHAPDRARFAKFVCMLYGAAPNQLEPLMNAAQIPDRTRQRCINDEPKRHTAWNTLLTPFRRRGVDPNLPGTLDPNTPGHKVEVVYEEPKNPALKPYADEIRKSGVFELIADGITKLYVLPRGTKIIFRDCGMENCFYQPQDGSVTMCWEMIGFVLNEFRKHGEGGAQPQPGPGPGPQPGPQPNPQPGPAMSLDQFMMGRWRTQIVVFGAPATMMFELQPQGGYQAQVQGTLNGQMVQLSQQGRWGVQPAGQGNVAQLSFQPMQWAPRQVCQMGGCMPYSPQPFSAQVQIMDRNTMRSADGILTRIQ